MSLTITPIMAQETIAASGDSTGGVVIDLQDKRIEGFFSVYVEMVGDGTAKIEYQISHCGSTENFLTPSSATDIVTSHTKTSGPGSDGKDSYSFSPVIGRWMKVLVTETGGADQITITVKIAIS